MIAFVGLLSCSSGNNTNVEDTIEKMVQQEIRISATLESRWDHSDHNHTAIQQMVERKLQSVPTTVPIPDTTPIIVDIPIPTPPATTTATTEAINDESTDQKYYPQYQNPYPTKIHPWPKLGRTPQNTNFTPSAIPTEVELLWSVKTGSESSSPIIGKNGIIYFLSAKERRVQGRYTQGFSALINEIDLVGLRQTGGEKFRTKLSFSENFINTPILSQSDHLYVPTFNGLFCEHSERGWVYQLDLEGIQEWYLGCMRSTDYPSLLATTETGVYIGPAHISDTNAIDLGNSVVGVSTSVHHNGQIITVDNQKNLLYSSDPSGEIIWQIHLPSPASHPVIGHEGRIFITHTGRLAAYSKNGNPDWMSSYLGSNHVSNPAIDQNGNIFVSTEQGMLFTFTPDASDVTVISIGKYPGNPIIDGNGNILITFDLALNLISPNGNIIWSRHIGLHRTNPAVGADGTVYTNCVAIKNKTPGICAYGGEVKDVLVSQVLDSNSKGVWYFQNEHHVDEGIRVAISQAIDEVALNPEFYHSRNRSIHHQNSFEKLQEYDLEKASLLWSEITEWGEIPRVCISDDPDKMANRFNIVRNVLEDSGLLSQDFDEDTVYTPAISHIRSSLQSLGADINSWPTCNVEIIVDIEPVTDITGTGDPTEPEPSATTTP